MRATCSRPEIMRVLSHPSVWPHLTTDMEPESFTPPSDAYYVTETGDDLFILLNGGSIHMQVLPSQRHRAVALGKRAVQWFFDNTDCRVIWADTTKPEIVKFAHYCGFSSVPTQNSTMVYIENGYC